MKLSNHHRKPAAKPATKPAPPVDTKQCTAITRAGARCKLGPGPFCFLHRPKPAARKP